MEKKIIFYFTILLFSLVEISSFAQDANFDWAVKMGGASDDYVHSIAADGSANVYTSGRFRSTATFGIHNITSVGASNGFITKQNSGGDVLWVKQLVSSGHAQAYGITADAAGNIYATGLFLGTTTFETHILTPPSGNNRAMFVVKYDTNGTIVWINQFDGNETGFGVGNEIKTDDAGNIYIAGYFNDTITFGATTLASEGGSDGFIMKQDPNGNVLWAKGMGGVNDSYAQSIHVDGIGNVYTAGFFNGSVDFEGHILTSEGQNDLFIAKYDSDGGMIWVRQSGGTGYDEAISVTTDASGNVYTTGHFENIVVFGSHTLTSTGNRDGFIAKYDSDGNIVWVKQLGGSDGTHNTHSVGVDIDIHGNVYITGMFNGTISFGSYTYNTFGGIDGFVAGYNTDGDILWAKQFGGTEQDRGLEIHIDVNGNILVAGEFIGTADFDPSGNSYTLVTSNLHSEVFVLKLNTSTAGINDHDANSNIGIYPNPAKDFVTLVNVKSNSIIKIIDMTGKTVYNGVVSDTHTTINMTEFINGIYFIEVNCEGAITDNRKIVVNK